MADEIAFWDADKHAKHLSCRELEVAVEDYLGYADGDLSRVLTVYGYRRLDMPTISALAVALDEVLRHLPTQRIRDAAMELAEAVREDYDVWSCGVVCEVRVDLLTWVRVERPEWVEYMPEELARWESEQLPEGVTFDERGVEVRGDG